MKNFRNKEKPIVPPSDFPHFTIGDDSRFGDLARRLLWQHSICYGPEWNPWYHGRDGYAGYPEVPSGPKVALWDGWLCDTDLWPAMDTDDVAQRMRSRWKSALLSRRLDDECNVDDGQGTYYAHPYGWPFPHWEQGAGVGWHFTYRGQSGELNTPLGLMFRPRSYATWEGFTSFGLSEPMPDRYGLAFHVSEKEPYFETPAFSMDADQGPFLQIRWFGTGFSGSPKVAFLLEGEDDYREENLMYCSPMPEEFLHQEEAFALLPLYRLPGYKGKIVKFRFYPGSAEDGATLGLTSILTLYDTRHNINGPQYLRGCCDYFAWTQDLDFLQRNMPKMRKVLRSYRKIHHLEEQGVVHTTWVGHEGRSGLWYDEKGEKHVEPGRGLHNNWLDLLPCGNLDTYATSFYYQALTRMAQLEEAIAAHPQWNIPEAFDAEDSVLMFQEAERIKEAVNRLLWNPETGRFLVAVDADQNRWDVGCTLINLEVVAGGLATEEHAKSVMDWISGRRIVEGDTSTGEDIYAFRFAPRITTKRNIDYYYWGWSTPEEIPFGNQIQDGGAALAFAYFDLISRLSVYGAENAWQRMKDLLTWFEDVQKEGGYASYYANRGMIMQGGGFAGGIGITNEFFESVLPVQSVLKGFLGLTALPDSLHFAPNLPASLPKIGVDRIRWGEATFSVIAENGVLSITVEGTLPGPITCSQGWEVQIQKAKN